LGFKHSQETKKLKSLQTKGNKNPFFNKTHSQETKNKISKANKNRKMSKEFSINRSEYMKKHPIKKEIYKRIAESNKIKINQYDLNMNFIQTHDSAADAVRNIKGLSTGHICSCCKGLRKTHKNFIWKYKY
jgi:ABC-type ATPase with predicted acetyltransferase domain